MNWKAALPIVVATTRNERFRFLTSDDNPDAESRQGYRNYVVRQATGAEELPNIDEHLLEATHQGENPPVKPPCGSC